MTTTSLHLPERLVRAIDALRIDRAECAVTVGDETISYDGPSQLRRDLAAALYRHWHAGTPGNRADLPRDVRRDTAFEDVLRAATPHRTSRTAAVVRSGPLDGPFGRHVLIDVGRMRLRIPVAEAPRPLPGTGSGTHLDLPAVRPALSPGFFLVNGSAGGPGADGDILRVYVHVDEAPSAPALWHAVLTALEARAVPYRAKVLAKARSYPRRDAIVLYLGKESWDAAPAAVAAVRGLPGLNRERPLLAEPVADGVSYAWEPRDVRPGWKRMSFGQHRTALVAAGVSAHVFDGADLHQAVADCLVEGGADPLAPHRNAGGPRWAPTVSGEAG
ncbi:T3SS effector HopA1 family protein [Streptomyces sp. HPF1205]|uniref:T3SS effector HopA1 family protein n=1 Tax=Streptomyces sp. HPF1205 TaxID=2873262 RepID=UPI001CEC93CB|nr:T3SS effector HopA1 family protein [Streptomyces sp. HPF1205]